MKPLRGMRPQDIAILLKIVSLGKNPWKTTDLASQLYISQSEISQALHRNWSAGLLDDSKKTVHKRSLVEFLIHGVKYVYPQKPGAIVRGIPTAHSAPPLSKMIQSSGDIYVWPDEEGTARGEMIQPLYPNVPKAAKADPMFYELLALVDAIRVGKSRESQIAADELHKRIQTQ
jgi:predicted transcriptional regulator